MVVPPHAQGHGHERDRGHQEADRGDCSERHHCATVRHAHRVAEIGSRRHGTPVPTSQVVNYDRTVTGIAAQPPIAAQLGYSTTSPSS